MLFKALLRRVNGGTDPASTKVSSSRRQSSGVAYEKYSNLPDLVLRLLYSGCQLFRSAPLAKAVGREISSEMTAQSVYAALEVIERVGVPRAHKAKVLDAMKYYSEGSDWAIRDKAAKALSTVINDQDIESEVDRLLSPSWMSQNFLHGRLLCLKHLLSRTDVPLTGGSISKCSLLEILRS